MEITFTQHDDLVEESVVYTIATKPDGHFQVPEDEIIQSYLMEPPFDLETHEKTESLQLSPPDLFI